MDRAGRPAARDPDLQRLWPRDRDCRIRADGHARLEPSLSRDRERFPLALVMGAELGQKRRAAWRDPRSTLGIVGLGRVGREVARRAAAFGCHILAANRSPRETGDGVERIYPLATLDEMLPLCDTVAICTAFGPETERLFDARRLARMKPTAFLVNIARGAIVDEDALYAALRDGTIGGAAIDVWWQYPNAAEPDRRGSRHPLDR